MPRKTLVDQLRAREEAESNGRPHPAAGGLPEAERGDAWEPPEARLGSGGDSPPLKQVGTLLATVTPEHVDWLWPSRIPRGKLTILDGDPGLGKSVLTMDLAARVSVGKAMPYETEANTPAGVVLLNAEDGLADTVLPRLLAAGANPERVLALDNLPGETGPRSPVLPMDLPYLRDAIKRMAAALVIIDPLMAFLSGDTNAHKDQDVRRALHPLADLATETGAAILVVRHLNKMAGGNPLYRGGGSIGIIGAARSGLLVARDPDNPDRRVLASTKSNLAKLAPALSFALETSSEGGLRVAWIGSSAHTAESLLAVPKDDEEKGAADEAIDVLREILAKGPVAADVAKKEARKAGVTDRTLQRAKAILGVRSRKLHFAGTWQWELPQSALVSAEDCQS